MLENLLLVQQCRVPAFWQLLRQSILDAETDGGEGADESAGVRLCLFGARRDAFVHISCSPVEMIVR